MVGRVYFPISVSESFWVDTTVRPQYKWNIYDRGNYDYDYDYGGGGMQQAFFPLLAIAAAKE